MGRFLWYQKQLSYMFLPFWHGLLMKCKNICKFNMNRHVYEEYKYQETLYEQVQVNIIHEIIWTL